jgi:hypothetical protein
LTVVDISLKIIILKDTGDIYNYNQHKKIMPVIIHLFKEISTTVKPVLRGHLWVKRWPFKTGDLLREVKFI